MSGLRMVSIERFKNISGATFELGDINVIVGSNNSGKSSVLQAIHFAITTVQSLNLENRLKGSGEKTFTVDPSRLIYVPSQDVHALGQGGRLWQEAEKMSSISLLLSDGYTLGVGMLKGKNRNIQVVITDVAVANRVAGLQTPFTVFTPGLAGIAKSEQYVSDGVLLRTIARGDANLVLRNTLLRLWDQRAVNSKWQEFMSDLLNMFPDVDICIRFSSQTDETINATVRTGTVEIPLELSGQGILQTIQILSYIHYFAPQVIALDEPDSHLHPNNQRLLCSLLKLIAQERRVQVILSTHSRHILDSLQGSAKLGWARGGVVDAPPGGSEMAILLDLGALDIKERIPAGVQVCVVLTEDERVNSLRAILESSGFDMGQTTVLPYYGCTNLHNLRPLVEMIKAVNRNAMIVIHKDRDYCTDQEITAWAASVRAMGADAFVTDGVDIESHLLRPGHLVLCNPGLSVEDASALVAQAMDATRNSSIEKYVNGRCDIERKAGTFGKLNVGALATEAPTLYESDPWRYCHSKTVIAKARELFQKANGSHLASQRKSAAASNAALASIARRLFSTQLALPKT